MTASLPTSESLSSAFAQALETMCFVIADPAAPEDMVEISRHASISISDGVEAWRLDVSSTDELLVEIACGLMGADAGAVDLECVVPETLLELTNVFGGEVIRLMGGEQLPLRPGIPTLEEVRGSSTETSRSVALDVMGEGLFVSLRPFGNDRSAGGAA